MTNSFIDASSQVNNCTGDVTLCSVNQKLSSNRDDSDTVAFGYYRLEQVYNLGSAAKSQTLLLVAVSLDFFISMILIIFYVS